MIEVLVSDSLSYAFSYLVLDFNGTLAYDGILSFDLEVQLQKLAHHLKIFVLTSDTFGTAERQLKESPCQLQVIPEQNQPAYKMEFVQKLGAEKTAAVGNGVNDYLMLKTAALGVCVIGREGASMRALSNAEIICTNITDALNLFINPKRIKATLRS
jgi:P-type E1-E2 ATPase